MVAVAAAVVVVAEAVVVVAAWSVHFLRRTRRGGANHRAVAIASSATSAGAGLGIHGDAPSIGPSLHLGKLFDPTPPAHQLHLLHRPHPHVAER